MKYQNFFDSLAFYFLSKWDGTVTLSCWKISRETTVSIFGEKHWIQEISSTSTPVTFCILCLTNVINTCLKKAVLHSVYDDLDTVLNDSETVRSIRFTEKLPHPGGSSWTFKLCRWQPCQVEEWDDQTSLFTDTLLLNFHWTIKKHTFPKPHFPITGFMEIAIISQGETVINISLEVTQTFIAELRDEVVSDM